MYILKCDTEHSMEIYEDASESSMLRRIAEDFFNEYVIWWDLLWCSGIAHRLEEHF